MFVEHNKETIADLERQKIALKDQLEFETKTSRIIKLEEQLYEVEDTIKKFIFYTGYRYCGLFELSVG
jgi:hypothetical protein